MANVAPVVGSVIASAAAVKKDGTAGEAIIQGDVLYKSSSDSKLYKADSNDTAAKAVVVGVALNAASAGQPVDYAEKDAALELGATTVTVGTVYVLSPTAGKMMPVDDLATGDRVTVLGVGVATNKIMLSKPIVSGVAVPA
jgi:predicted transcriptional regulator